MQQKYYVTKYKNNIAIKEIAVKEIAEKIHEGDIYARIINNVIHRHNEFLRVNNIKINLTPMELLGCNRQTFIDYLAEKLKDDMTFDNYGVWEIDHIYPVSKINVLNTDDVIKYFNYKNLQPLDKIENIKKSNKIIE